MTAGHATPTATEPAAERGPAAPVLEPLDPVVEQLRAGKRLGTNHTLRGAKLIDCDLSGANLAGVDLSGADLSRANLTSANLVGATLEDTVLFGATLDQAELLQANLRRANLTEVSAKGTGFGRADLEGAQFFNGTLAGASFTQANLTETDFRTADLTGIYRYMLLTRGVEERLEILFKQGHIVGGLYRSLGQEGLGAGVLTLFVIGVAQQVEHLWR